jgi:hypothetical protein
MEEETTNKLMITFTIDAPTTITDSNFNTLILRLEELRKMKDDTCKTEEELKWNNLNVEKMKEILDNFKFKEI